MELNVTILEEVSLRPFVTSQRGWFPEPTVSSQLKEHFTVKYKRSVSAEVCVTIYTVTALVTGKRHWLTVGYWENTGVFPAAHVQTGFRWSLVSFQSRLTHNTHKQ